MRRLLANSGHPVTALHRVRYGAIRLDEAAVGEGEAAVVEGDALEWALALRTQRSPKPPPPPPHASKPRATAAPSAPVVGPTADPVEAMARAWRPRAKDVRLVIEGAGASGAA